MQQFRTFLAISLLVVLAWSRAAAALPLVWCLGSDGHNVIELANSDGCLGARKIDINVDSGFTTSLIGLAVCDHSDCRDIALPNELRTPVKAFKTLPPPVPPTSFVQSFEPHLAPWPTRLTVRLEPATDYLVQLRTVVLRL